MSKKILEYFENKRKDAEVERIRKLRIAEEIKDYLVRKYECRVYLFGSLLDAGKIEYGDIDILIEGVEITSEEYIELLLEIEEEFGGENIDVFRKEDMKSSIFEYTEIKELT